MSDTIWIAIITACATTIPQIILAIISNKQTIKIKKLEYFELAKKNAIIDFIDAVGNCINSGSGLTIEIISNYYKHLNTLRVYFPDLDEKILEELTKKIYSNNNDIQTAIKPILKELSKLLSEIM